MRYLAHTNCCELFSMTNKNAQAGMELRKWLDDVLSRYSLEFRNGGEWTGGEHGLPKDVNKPWKIWPGDDRTA